MLSYQALFRRYKMSKMPLTRLHSVVKSKFPPFILWLRWLSRILHLPGRLTRIWKTPWNRCWNFWRIIKLRLLSTRTRFLLTRVTRDLKRLHFVCFNRIRVGLIRVTVNFTRTCLMLRLVTNFFFSFSFMLKKCWLSSQRQEEIFVLYLHATCLTTLNFEFYPYVPVVSDFFKHKACSLFRTYLQFLILMYWILLDQIWIFLIEVEN